MNPYHCLHDRDPVCCPWADDPPDADRRVGEMRTELPVLLIQPD